MLHTFLAYVGVLHAVAWVKDNLRVCSCMSVSLLAQPRQLAWTHRCHHWNIVATTETKVVVGKCLLQWGRMPFLEHFFMQHWKPRPLLECIAAKVGSSSLVGVNNGLLSHRNNDLGYQCCIFYSHRVRKSFFGPWLSTKQQPSSDVTAHDVAWISLYYKEYGFPLL